MGRDEIIEGIKKKKIIAIVRGIPPEQCGPLAEALYAGGIRFMEITFDQSSADGCGRTVQGIKAAIRSTRGKMCVGAGTVMTQEQLTLAKEAGAQFLISPHTDGELIRQTVELGLVSIPGAMTPSEAVVAWQAGADFVKIFPAGNLGSAYIKSLKAPLSHIPLLAVGGISEENAEEFIRAGACGVGMGGRLVNAAWAAAGEFGKITELALRITAGLETKQQEKE